VTAFAIKFYRDIVSIASDTLAYMPDKTQARPLGFVNKVIAFPHHRAALFGRGQIQIIGDAAAAITISPELFSIEDIAERLPATLAEASELYCVRHHLDDWHTLGLAEVVLAGWSETESRMRMWLFNSYDRYKAQDDAAGFYGQLMTMPRLANHERALDLLPIDKALIAAMYAERKFFADYPQMVGGAMIGGEIVITEISPRTVSQRVAHRFPDYSEMRIAAAAVVGRILREGAPDISLGIAHAGEAVYASELQPAQAGVMTRQQRRAAEKAARKAARQAA
jgi:hypothetical protein